MKTFFKNIFIKSKIYAGIDIYFESLNDYSIDFILIKKYKNKINILETHQNISSIDKLKINLKPLTPLVIVIHGKGILHKIIESKNGDETNNITKTVKGLNPIDFCTQKIILSETEILVSMIRKTVLEKIVSELLTSDVRIVEVILGPFTLEKILPFCINKQDSKDNLCIVSSENRIIFKNNKLSKVFLVNNNKFIPENKLFSDITLNKIIIPYSALIQYLFYTHSTKKFRVKDKFLDVCAKWYDEEIKLKKEYRKFSYFFFIILFFYFLLQIISINKQGNQSLNSSKSNIKQKELIIKKEKVKQNETLLSEKIWTKNIPISVISNYIGFSSPEGITLDNLQIFPIHEKQQANGIQVFRDHNIILISGKCDNSSQMNIFQKKLKSFPWIKKMTVGEYKYNSQQNTNLFLINIETGQ